MERSEKIKLLREQKGLTQGDIAGFIGCSPGYVSQIENKIRKPSVEFIGKFCKIVGVSSDYILYNDLIPQMVHEPEPEYQVLPTSTKKLLNNVKEILESGNEVMADALKANIKAFLEAIRVTKNQNEDKGCG